MKIIFLIVFLFTENPNTINITTQQGFSGELADCGVKVNNAILVNNTLIVRTEQGVDSIVGVKSICYDKQAKVSQ